MPNRMRILLVEDEAIIRELVQTSLEDADFDVVTAGHGGHAIQLLEAAGEPVGALLTDVSLGSGPDGWAVARYARKLKPNLPVIYFSGTSGSEWAAEGVPKSSFLHKPISPHQIVHTVRAALAGCTDADRQSGAGAPRRRMG